MAQLLGNVASNLLAQPAEQLSGFVHNRVVQLVCLVMVMKRMVTSYPAMRRRWGQMKGYLNTIFMVYAMFASSRKDKSRRIRIEPSSHYDRYFSRSATHLSVKLAMDSALKYIAPRYESEIAQVSAQLRAAKKVADQSAVKKEEQSTSVNPECEENERWMKLTSLGFARALHLIFSNVLLHCLIHTLFAMVSRRTMVEKPTQKKTRVQATEISEDSSLIPSLDDDHHSVESEMEGTRSKLLAIIFKLHMCLTESFGERINENLDSLFVRNSWKNHTSALKQHRIDDYLRKQHNKSSKKKKKPSKSPGLFSSRYYSFQRSFDLSAQHGSDDLRRILLEDLCDTFRCAVHDSILGDDFSAHNSDDDDDESDDSSEASDDYYEEYSRNGRREVSSIMSGQSRALNPAVITQSVKGYVSGLWKSTSDRIGSFTGMTVDSAEAEQSGTESMDPSVIQPFNEEEKKEEEIKPEETDSLPELIEPNVTSVRDQSIRISNTEWVRKVLRDCFAELSTVCLDGSPPMTGLIDENKDCDDNDDTSREQREFEEMFWELQSIILCSDFQMFLDSCFLACLSQWFEFVYSNRLLPLANEAASKRKATSKKKKSSKVGLPMHLPILSSQVIEECKEVLDRAKGDSGSSSMKMDVVRHSDDAVMAAEMTAKSKQDELFDEWSRFVIRLDHSADMREFLGVVCGEYLNRSKPNFIDPALNTRLITAALEGTEAVDGSEIAQKAWTQVRWGIGEVARVASETGSSLKDTVVAQSSTVGSWIASFAHSSPSEGPP